MNKEEREALALRIINALAPLSRRDEWWKTDGPVAIIERELMGLEHQAYEVSKAVSCEVAKFSIK